MVDDPRTNVTVIGLGAMGTALAEAYLDAGHPTTVWNRTEAKAARLVEKGARGAPTAEAAVASSSLVIACLSNYAATREALAPAGPALAGRTLVTLNSGARPAPGRWPAGRRNGAPGSSTGR